MNQIKVAEAIDNIKNKKAPGADGITAAMLKELLKFRILDINLQKFLKKLVYQRVLYG